MNDVWHDHTNPIPVRRSPPRMGTIMIRFAGLLFLAVVALALALGPLIFCDSTVMVSEA